MKASKKLTLLGVLLLIVIMLPSCAKHQPGYGLTLADIPTEAMPTSSDAESDLIFYAENVTPEGMTLRFSHNFLGGYAYSLDRYDGIEWQPAKLRRGAKTIIPAVAIFFYADTPQTVNWTQDYGTLPPGAYRYVKNVGDIAHYAYFEIPQ